MENCAERAESKPVDADPRREREKMKAACSAPDNF